MLSTAVCKSIEAGRVNGRILLSGHDLESVPPQVYDPDVPLPPVKGTKAAAGEGEWWGWDEIKKLDLSRNRCDTALVLFNFTVLKLKHSHAATSDSLPITCKLGVDQTVQTPSSGL
eukprot:1002693-Pelagomonas_calceolata.AAC.1